MGNSLFFSYPRRLLLLGLLVCLSGQRLVTPAAAQLNTNRLELRDGDRVVFLGDTFFEREYHNGYIETRLTLQYPGRNIIFRNLGWSADTPLGVSRAGFKTPEEGFDRLKEQLALVKPTVAFLSYGMAASFDGEAGLPKFKAELTRLVDTVQQIAGTNLVRFVFLGPIKHEKLVTLPLNPKPHNDQLALYSQAIKEVAEKRRAHFVDFLQSITRLESRLGKHPLTDNGIHLNAYGYAVAAQIITDYLQWDVNNWRVGTVKDGTIRKGSSGLNVTKLQFTPTNVTFNAVEDVLPDPPVIESNRPVATLPVFALLQFQGLAPGQYTLLVDGKPVKTTTGSLWGGGQKLDNGPAFEQAEELRRTIVKKNELFFHRWRPENNTYLFLFRANEQGQNAKEIPQFDPLIQELEQKIAKLRKPVLRSYALVPAETVKAAATPVPAPAPALAPVPPLPPPTFDLDPNLEISLYAENPLLAKPIQMNFDAEGRLWIASSSVYPQIKPGQEANDKILVLEDADGDGKAEKSTVFADGLLIPTGIEPGDGGVYVGQSTELLHLKDTDGDGKADQRRVVLSGFGTEDTHHILHTLRWGHDGQLYMNQSIYIHTHTETPHGVVRLNSGGILNLRPGTMELGIHMKGLVNSWGHAIDAFGQSFATDGASSADSGLGGINWVIPQGMYLTYERARRTIGSVSPGAYPKFCGLEIIRSRHFPDDWQGSFVTCDFRAHRLVRFAMSEKDSAYVTREMPDLVRTKDVTFRPIDVKLGPDGALYIADWSNPIIQHGEVDFRDDRRDHEHGRIWRVSYKGRPKLSKPNLVNARDNELLDNLLSPDEFVRAHSKRLLVERGDKVRGPLIGWTRQHTNEPARLEALWAHQAIDFVDTNLLVQLLEAQDPRVRAAAVRVLSSWQQRLPGREGGTTSPSAIADYTAGWPTAPLPLPLRHEIPTERALELLAVRVADEHPRVRVEALRALARIPSARAAELALSAAEKPLDPYLEHALWLTINNLAEPWLTAIKSGAWKAEGRPRQLEHGLKAIEPAQASEVLGLLLGGKPLPRDGSGPWLDLIGQAGTVKEVRQLFDQVLQDGFDEATTARALSALNQAVRLRRVQPAGDLTAVGRFFTHANEAVRTEAVRLAGGWRDLGQYFPKLVALAGDTATPSAVRAAAFDSLRSIGGDGAINGLLPLTDSKVDPIIRRQAVTALAALAMNKAVPAAVATLLDSKTEADALSLWRALLNNRGAGGALAKALPKSGIPELAARSGLRAAREGGRNEPDLVLALTRGSDLATGDVTLTDAELKQMAMDVVSKGDPARGELVYRRKDLSCLACHAIGGAGGKVGPDMTSIGASAPLDYLIESVWFPNKKIKEGFHPVSIETKDGQEFAGVLVRENNEQVVLRDATSQEISVAKNNIQKRTIGTTSLMPAGLIDHLAPQERLDLFRFLAELGKPGPFDASKGSVARTWKLRAGTHTVEQFGEDKFVAAPIKNSEWASVYSLVDGRLPRVDIQEGLAVGKYLGVVGLYAATQLQVPRDGLVKFKLTGAESSPVWLDGQPVPGGAERQTQLTAGTHNLIVRLDPKNLPEYLRAETADATFVGN